MGMIQKYILIKKITYPKWNVFDISPNSLGYFEENGVQNSCFTISNENLREQQDKRKNDEFIEIQNTCENCSIVTNRKSNIALNRNTNNSRLQKENSINEKSNIFKRNIAKNNEYYLSVIDERGNVQITEAEQARKFSISSQLNIHRDRGYKLPIRIFDTFICLGTRVKKYIISQNHRSYPTIFSKRYSQRISLGRYDVLVWIVFPVDSTIPSRNTTISNLERTISFGAFEKNGLFSSILWYIVFGSITR